MEAYHELGLGHSPCHQLQQQDLICIEPQTSLCGLAQVKLLLWSELVYYDFSIPRDLQRRKRDPGANPKTQLSQRCPCTCLAFLLAQTTKKEEVCVVPMETGRDMRASLDEQQQQEGAEVNPSESSEGSAKKSLPVSLVRISFRVIIDGQLVRV